MSTHSVTLGSVLPETDADAHPETKPEISGPVGAPRIEQLPNYQQGLLKEASRERTKRARAKPMSPDDRRTAILDATLPLIKKHGFDITTKQIASAAGVAEGTLFRVFSDKDDLLKQALEAALDPSETEEKLEAIDPSNALEERVRQAAEILRDRLMSVTELMVAIRMPRPPENPQRPEPRHAGITERLTAIFEPDRNRLRIEPADAGRLLRLHAFAAFHPLITEHRPLTAEEVTDVLLYGITERS